MLSNFKNTLWKKMIKGIEDRRHVFLTTHERPVSRSSFGKFTKKAKLPPCAVVIQGPLALDFDFTVETVKIYKETFPGASLIVSTWKGENKEALERLKNLGCVIVENEKPKNPGWGNINMQIVTSSAGVRKAKELGAQYAFKTRTDQRVYATDVYPYFLSLLKTFPPKNPRQKGRLIGSSFNTFKYRPYSVSDTFLFGPIEDMLLFWDTELDERVGIPNYVKNNLLDWVKQRQPEIYLVAKYLEKLGRTIEMTLADSWKACGDYFCIIDQKSVDIFFLKYERELEYRRAHYDGSYLDEELYFKDWLLLHDGFFTDKDASLVPVEKEFATKFD